jgi:hypothetical protein
MSKEALKQVVDAIINDKQEEAEVSFHTYLSDKMKDMLGGEYQAPVPAPAADEVVPPTPEADPVVEPEANVEPAGDVEPEPAASEE